MSEGPPSPKRLRLDLDDLGNLSREELIEKLREQDDYLAYQGRQRGRSSDKDDGDEKEGDDKLKQQSMESSRRENTLVLRLTNKEQELQDCLNQIAEMKTSQTQNSAQLRSLLLDPAVNLVFQRMAKEMEDCKEKLKQTQNELSAWKFTADSQMGKRLMAKCRMLLQENEDLGKMISSGRTAKLEAEIALQKTMVTEMKTNQDEMNEFVGELEEDVEGMQSMIYVLQQQLKETKEQLAASEADNARLRTLLAAASAQPSSQPEPGGGGRETTANSSSNSGGGGDSGRGSGSGKGGGNCSSDGCEPETTVGGDRTSACDVEMSTQQQQQQLVNSRSESTRTRTTESLSPRTTNTPQTSNSPQTANSLPATNAVTTQPGGEGIGKKSNCGRDLEDLQQPNGRTSEVVENSQHQCSMSAAETPDLRTDQTCDRPQTTVPSTKSCDDQAADILHKSDRELRPSEEDVDMKTCNQEARPVRNGGLEAVTQPGNENDEM